MSTKPKKDQTEKKKEKEPKETKEPKKKTKKETREKNQKLNCEVLEASDLKAVIHAELDEKTLLGHHKKSFDEFTSTGIHQIVTQLFQAENTIVNERNKTDEDNQIETIQFTAKFNDVTIDRPTIMSYTTGTTNVLTPNLARRNNKNYSAAVNFSMTITAKAFLHGSTEPIVRTEEIKDFRFASMPIMCGSKLCHTYGASRETLLKLEEDPRDEGGYFIIKGVDWAVDAIESRIFNAPHVFRNIGHDKEITRLEFISKPGDDFENSSSMMIRYLNTGHIFVRFDSNIYLKLLEIPFYVIFRLLGMTSDKEVMDNILYGYTDETGAPDIVSSHMFNILKRAFKITDPVFGQAVYMTDQASLLDFVSKQTAILSEGGTIGVTVPEDKIVRYLFKNLLGLLDKNLLPHIGLAASSRHTKLRYLGHLIHKALLVEMQIEDSTDRDSLINKSIMAAGSSYAKSFKTQFNIAIVQPIKKKLTKDFKSMPFSQVSLGQSVRSAVHGLDLERAMIQAITTGNKEITMMNRQIQNRLASEILHRKNQTNVISTGRVIRTPNTSASKQDARADEMRRVHPTYAGYICPAQSADTGEQVGMVKQMAASATISSASSSQMLKDIIRADPLLIPLEKCYPAAIHKYNLCKIMVNGDWIGCCLHSPIMFYKYREMRRSWAIEESGSVVRLESSGIEPFATIHWNTRSNELGFWVSDGRMLRPLLIVRNNTELDPIGVHLLGSKMDPKASTPEKSGFVQDIVFDQDDLNGLRAQTLTVTDLQHRGVLEYIAPLELEKCYLAKSLDDLRANAHNPLKQFTHCEIPECLLGIPALTCPFSNSSPCARTTFQTNQVKQTCGWYALNWPFRVDKHAFLQYYCESPIITTMANNYVYPNGVNATIAIASYGGFNQEDSLCINKSAAERGIYEGLHFNFTKSELENGEHFGTPDEVHTMDIKKHANYSLLKDGMVQKGQLLKKDDVIIGKYFTISKPTDHRIYKDLSLVYTSSEAAMVESVTRGRNEEDKEFCTVKYSSVRRLGTGHKFCLTANHEVLTQRGWVPIADVLLTDLVATLSSNGEVQYDFPTRIYQLPHDGRIYSIRSIYVSLDTTLNHKMYVSENGTDFELREAKDIATKNVFYKKNCIGSSCDEEVEQWADWAAFNVPDLETACNVQIRCLMSGYAADIIPDRNQYLVNVHTHDLAHLIDAKETINDFKGMVYCIEVPNHVFYVRHYDANTGSYKPVWTGNSSRSGQKGMTGIEYDQSDMPFTESGMIPDIILNPHSMPSRMTINQLIEQLLAKYCAMKGVFADGTIFSKVQFDSIADALEALGFSYSGTEKLNNGFTGEWIDVDIFIAPCFYQRLQKYVEDSMYSINSGPTDVLTRGAVEGGKICLSCLVIGS
jgi:DNA-directed RNA polymerase beta subunit